VVLFHVEQPKAPVQGPGVTVVHVSSPLR
jgi:hypothetical protein